MPTLPARPGLLDARAAAAIRRGLAYLYRRQKADGTWDWKYAAQQPGGVESLVLLTALSAGEDLGKPQLAAALKHVDGLEPLTVYVRAVRAMVYARLPRERYGDRLAEDAAWLAKCQRPSGGWGYGPGHRTTRENLSWTDVSNTFLAMLALRDAEAAGVRVPGLLWMRCRRYWAGAANPDGGISYQPPGGPGFRLRASSYGSMTSAGLTAYFILADRYAAAQEPAYTGQPGRRRAALSPYRQPVFRALKWLKTNYIVKKNPRWIWGAGEAYEYYYLYCLQHVADESGTGQIGSDDLARAAADVIVSRQRADGSWIDPQMAAGADDGKLTVVRTCFALLALTKARGPIVLHKLALPGGPAGDPRDAANLARWLGRTLKWAASWRAAAPDTPSETLAAAPVLYLNVASGQIPQTLAPKVRAFVADGGTVLVQPFAGEDAAVKAAKAYFAAVFPRFSGADLPGDHPVFNVRFKLPPAQRPAVFALGDACRTRVFILTSDVSGAWHQGRWATHPQAFEFAANLVLYTTDLAAPKGKLAAAAPAARAKPARSIHVARVRHAGNWDVCPRAMDHLGGVLTAAVSLGVKELPAADLTRPVAPETALLWLTGTRGLTLGAAQRKQLKQYLAGGGTLFVDSAMGDRKFHEDASAALAAIFGPSSVVALPADSPLLTGSFGGGVGSDVTRVGYTRAAAAGRTRPGGPQLTCVRIGRRIAVILSPYSVTCPLEGHPTYGCKGLATPDARRLAANIVLYAALQRGGGR